MNDMGYISDRLRGITRVSAMVKKMKVNELTEAEIKLLATEPSLEKANQKWPELSAKATAIFNRAVAAVEQERQAEAQQASKCRGGSV